MNNIAATVIVADHLICSMDQKQIKEYVIKELECEISKEIVKYMDIKEHKDVLSNTITYTGTLTASSSNYVTVSNNTISGFNPTNHSYSQINLRVVEYTKDGKVTRVELQRYDDSNNDWFKIPRVQIEE